MRELSTHELRRKLLQSNERLYVIDALPADSYRHRHIPGALSLPLEELPARAEKLLPDRLAEVVVYCSGPR